MVSITAAHRDEVSRCEAQFRRGRLLHGRLLDHVWVDPRTARRVPTALQLPIREAGACGYHQAVESREDGHETGSRCREGNAMGRTDGSGAGRRSRRVQSAAARDPAVHPRGRRPTAPDGESRRGAKIDAYFLPLPTRRTDVVHASRPAATANISVERLASSSFLPIIGAIEHGKSDRDRAFQQRPFRSGPR
jgi:hypothetical protein